MYSKLRFANMGGLPLAQVEWFISMYLSGSSGCTTFTCDPRFQSVEQQSKLPHAIIFTGDGDILRDEGIQYANSLSNAGVIVENLTAPVSHMGHRMFDYQHVVSKKLHAKVREIIWS